MHFTGSGYTLGEHYAAAIEIGGKALRVLVHLALVLMFTGCASAERFGADGDESPLQPFLDVECDSSEDCWDGDPETLDLCGPDGICQFLPDGDVDTETQTDTDDGECEFDMGLEEDTQFQVLVDGVVDKVAPTIPISMGKVIKVHVRNSRRLWVDTPQGGREDLLMVLLSDCANAAVNRIAWGNTIYTEELPEGDYYLAIFAEKAMTVTVDTRFLLPTYCEGAQNLDIGSELVSVDGYADDFSGGCVDDSPLEHRGDRLFTFEVPQSKLWDVRIDLYPLDGYLRHHLYLTQGCGEGVAVEMDCSYTLEEPSGGQKGEGMRASVFGEKLKPGRYYLVVDTLKPQDWESGEVELSFQVESTVALGI